jgi:hypothetical protein
VTGILLNMSDWNKCNGFEAPAKLAVIMMRVQRIMLANTIQQVEQFIGTQDLDEQTHTTLTVQLRELREQLGRAQ